ncbi:MAG TPA: hypothetical protein GX405_12210 [Rhizobiales bacterium]|nr:hypothetical protein [Hyphomicrobiales bacterium]
MIDLACHVIETKGGTFDPSVHDDRHDAALAGLVRAKAQGRAIKAPARAPKRRVTDILDALGCCAEVPDGRASRTGMARRRAVADRAPATRETG